MIDIRPILTAAIRRALPLVAALVLFATFPALALESGPYSMEILVDGRPLSEHAARGTTYVEALEGREYSIRLRNRTSRRIAVALAVDGLNTIDASRTDARSAPKWILGPHETVTIDGWQTDGAHARRFFFTSEQASYGAWLGETGHLGLISAAVFRERPRRRPAPISKPRAKERESRQGSAAPGLEPEASAGKSEDRARRSEGSESGEAAGRVLGQDAPSDDFAATGIGRRTENRVVRVRFEAERRAAATLDLRYEYRDALVRLGVLPRLQPGCPDPLSRRERARGFADTGFAPDPFACRTAR